MVAFPPKKHYPQPPGSRRSLQPVERYLPRTNRSRSDLPDDPTAQIPIEELQLSVRAYNCLKRAQVNSVADLLDYTQEDLLEIKNFGQKSAEEVVEALQRRLGITLPQERGSKHS